METRHVRVAVLSRMLVRLRTGNVARKASGKICSRCCRGKWLHRAVPIVLYRLPP